MSRSQLPFMISLYVLRQRFLCLYKRVSIPIGKGRRSWQAPRMRGNRVMLVIAGSCEPVCLQRSAAEEELRWRLLSFHKLKLITCPRWQHHSSVIILKRLTICWYSLLLSIYKKSINVHFTSWKQTSPGQWQRCACSSSSVFGQNVHCRESNSIA